MTPLNGLSFDVSNVVYSPLRGPQDEAGLRSLHEECFPVRYNDAFYEGVTRMNTYRNSKVLSMMALHSSNPDSSSAGTIENGTTTTTMIGCALLQLDGDDSKVSHWEDIVEPVWRRRKNTTVAYLMTLAVQANVRRQGIASKILQRCIESVSQDPNCCALYLHVMTENLIAQKFYEYHGFIKVTTVPGFYLINGKRSDSHIYALYFHGAKPPTSKFPVSSFFESIGSVFTSILGFLSSFIMNSSSNTDQENIADEEIESGSENNNKEEIEEEEIEV
jgi:ribosomal protein S18 acetylase RimI-like enzyme